jgi:hypothetical protein
MEQARHGAFIFTGVIIDGVLDLARTRARMPDQPDDYFVKPDDVAGMVATLVAQPRSAWTFELEARPFGETWSLASGCASRG